ncbi:dethiobiotin synthase [Geothrix sp. PMB-07]|uniref:dethiobiotin synthase n=1 Tax=Geothrix sp. PMB-07 TaxID=3068640 RepID=UPI0027426E80|nr:dethiobiotin synthase [Geothrix sp. PMB-07]WLT32195.1 dethiobiotin synthase [Geothrix sp. PMB-07]
MDFTTLPSPLWVLGTGTGVGKTHVSSRIARTWAQSGPVVYRKPFQTGVDRADHPEADASAVSGPGITAENHTLLRAPLSPLAAAQLEGKTLDLADAAHWCQRPAEGRILLEGVGGLMVPLAPSTHFLAWATELKIPCVLVALGGLGTLNHTLLSAEALMLRGWRIEAVLLNPGADGCSREAAAVNASVLRGFLPMPVVVLD